MEREEQIISEAKKHYSDSINCHNAFLHGVEWADEHPVDIWHDAKEVPKDYLTQILYQDKYGICYITSRQEMYAYDWEWQRYVADFQMVRWAYINDLLPKGGEE